MRKSIRIGLVSAVALGLAACSEAPPPLPPLPPPHHHHAKAPEVSETAPKTPEYVYAYNPIGKRDPFRSPMESGLVKKAQATACDEPLCQWDLDQLTLVAVITGEANPEAMIEDPNGVGYIVHRRSRVGKRSGRVTQILRDSITVTEYFNGPDGKSKPNPVVLAVKQDQKTAGDVDLFTGRLYP